MITTYALLLLFTQTVPAATATDYVIGIQDVLNVTVFPPGTRLAAISHHPVT